jgi:hypothetical protein
VSDFKKNWKYYLGLSLFIYSCFPYLIALVLPFLGLSAAVATSIAAGIVISGEIAFFASVALLGKPFMEAIKAKARQWLKRPVAPPKPVNRPRHIAGVALFFISLLPYFVAEALLLLGYTSPRHVQWIIGLLLAGDAMFVASLFVLGGDFWERLKKLFEWHGAAVGGGGK